MFGRKVLATTGRDISVVADIEDIEWKTGGITLDWGVVAAVGGDTTLPDDTIIPSGQKGLRFGQILCRINDNSNGGVVGYYGPYNPAATDGRQLLVRGESFILNKTVLQQNPAGFNAHNSDHPAVFDGGRAWKARILMTAGAHSLAAGPTVAEFEAAFPDITYVQNK